MVLLFSQSCHEDDGRKDSSSDSEQKITQQLLDQELLVHQERLIQLLDQGDNEIFMDHEAPILTADLSGTEMLCTEGCTPFTHIRRFVDLLAGISFTSKKELG